MSRGRVIAHAVAAALFAVSAAIQLNDPDPLRWMAIYGGAAAASVAAAFGRGRILALVVLVAALAWSAFLLPDVLPGLRPLDLVRPMSEKTPQVELGRELLGLLIVAAWMVVALKRGQVLHSSIRST